MRDAVRMLDCLANPVRLRLLRLLRKRELCVCELVDTLRVPQYVISRHLRVLRGLGLVVARREGRWMHYRVSADPTGSGLGGSLLTVLAGHLEGTPAAQRDDRFLVRRLARGRVGRCLTRPAGRSNGLRGGDRGGTA